MPIIGTIASSYLQATGSYYSIASATAGSSSPFIEFTSIPNTYQYLRMIICGRSTSSGTQQVRVQFNGDTSTNYSISGLYANGSNSFGSYYYYQTYTAIEGLEVTGSDAEANIPGISFTDIYDYARTDKLKTILGHNGRASKSPLSTDTRMIQGVWHSTNSITSIKLALLAGNWVQNSTVSLYGLKG